MQPLNKSCIETGCQQGALQRIIDQQAAEIVALKAQITRKAMGMGSIELPDGITGENIALWCEITDHAFSAKDTEKVVMNYKGETRLSCGQCAAGLFSVPTTVDVRKSLQGKAE